jgi:hypothetical protein
MVSDNPDEMIIFHGTDPGTPATVRRRWREVTYGWSRCALCERRNTETGGQCAE